MGARIDRHLSRHGNGWRYQRQTPGDVAHLDPRGAHIRERLTAADIRGARLQRDICETRDNAFWAALRAGRDAVTAWQAYDAQTALQQALRLAPIPETDRRRMTDDARAALGKNMRVGFEMVAGVKLVEKGADGKPRVIAEDVLAEAMERFDPTHPIARAALGVARPVAVTLTEACRQHVADSRLANRDLSPQQRRKREERRERAVSLFVVSYGGDPEIAAIRREDALRFHRDCRDKMLARDKGPDVYRKAMSSLRAIWQSHFDREGDTTRPNPFDRLTFARRESAERASLSPEWIADHILRPGKLSSLNAEARAILTILAETGARPSEICNLPADAIRLDAPVPHISIAPRRGRALKAKSSRRDVPLVGAALEAMKRHPGGFPRYLDREDSLSAVLMKSLRPVLPEGASVYSLRHAYVDRLRAAGVGDDMRRGIVGHSGGGSHTGYGRGFPLELVAEAMRSIALPFDPALFKD